MQTCRLFALSAWLALVPLAAAQTVQHAWKNRASVYMMGAGIDGTVTVKGVSAAVDSSFSDIMSNLQYGAMVNFRSESDRYALGFDGIFMALGGDTPNGLAKVDVDQWTAEFSGSVRINPRFELLAAARYSGFATEIKTTGPGATSVKKTVDWVDPIVGARMVLPLSQRWSFVARGDIGGFGVGADFTWQAIASFQYAYSESFTIIAGYRIIDVDYESGEGASLYVYDVTTSGPGIGLSWSF